MWRIIVLVTLSLVAAASAQTTKILPFDGTIVNTSNVPSKTTANLPICNASSVGQIYIVTDALLPSLGVAIVGGGAVTVFVACNATNWLVR